MIFVSTGSRKFQFDRLIRKLDQLVEDGEIKEEVFAQIAETSYLPKHLQYKRYLSPEEFNFYQDKSSLIISHAGTGALIGSLKKKKQVIAVPRLSKYKEHSDDHQLQIASVLEEKGYLRCVYDIDNLGAVIKEMRANPIEKIYDRDSYILPIIENCINEWFEGGETK